MNITNILIFAIVLWGTYEVVIRLSVFLHELGHVVVALLFGVPSAEISWGRGTLLKSYKLGKLTIALQKGHWKEGGSTYDLDGFSTGKETLVLLGGVLLNGMLAVCAFVLFLQGGTRSVLDACFLAAAFANGYLFFVNALPMQVKSLDGKETIDNDGQRLVNLWRKT